MKTKLAAVLMFLMLLSTSISLLIQIEPAKALPVPELRVEPDYVPTGAVGSEFSVNVTMNNLDAGWNCTGVQFRMPYDETLLEFVSATEGPFMSAAGPTIFISTNEDNPPWGWNVLVGIQLLPPYTSFPSGTGTLATITFKVIYQPVVPDTAGDLLLLVDTLVLDKDVVEIPHTIGSPSWIEPPPVGARFGLEPDYVLGGVIGSEFSVDVTMDITDVVERVVAVQLRILYCEELLEVVSMAEGSLFASVGLTYFIPINEYHPDWGWNVLIGILLLPNATGHWNTFPSGTGTLATITFKVLSRPVAPDTAFCEITLVDTQILNDEIEEIDHLSDVCLYEALQILPPTLSVNPHPIVGGVIGSEFSVNVTMNDLDVDWNCTAVQFRLPYDPNLLEFINAVEGPFMAQFGDTWLLSYHEDWPPYGPHVLLGILVLPNATGDWTTFPSGTGTLATITFKVLDRPVAPDVMWYLLDLEDTMLITDEIEKIPHSITGSLYKALQIFPPTLKVEPALVEMTSAYQLFDVNITINDLDADWNMTAVAFRLAFDCTLLDATNVPEGMFLIQFGDTYYISYIENWPPWGCHVLMGIILLEYQQYPSGSGTLATITFNATYQGRDPDPWLACNLTLADTMLLNEDLEEIPHYTEDGYYIIYSTNIGDVNRDGKVDMRDIGAVGSAFGTSPEYPGEPPRWNELYDVNYDGKIDMKDVAIAARNFGWPYE